MLLSIDPLPIEIDSQSLDFIISWRTISAVEEISFFGYYCFFRFGFASFRTAEKKDFPFLTVVSVS